MTLTPAQAATLKAAIDNNPTWSAYPNTTDGNIDLAVALNQTAAPAWIVWKTDVSIEEIMRNGMDWARVDNLSVGKARIWDWLGRLGYFDASKPNVRAGIDATWVGTAADLAVRAAVYVHCKRSATNAEKVLSTGTGTDAVPATMGFVGAISAADVQAARNS